MVLKEGLMASASQSDCAVSLLFSGTVDVAHTPFFMCHLLHCSIFEYVLLSEKSGIETHA